MPKHRDTEFFIKAGETIFIEGKYGIIAIKGHESTAMFKDAIVAKITCDDRTNARRA